MKPRLHNSKLSMCGTHLLNVAAERACKDARQALDGRVVVGPVDLADVDQRRYSLHGRGGGPDDVQAAREQSALNLHQLAVHIANDLEGCVWGGGQGTGSQARSACGTRHLKERAAWGRFIPRLPP